MQIIKLKTEEKGFSLIETLVSLLILMIVFLGVYNLALFSIRINADNESYIKAINIANQKMEYIRNLPYDDVGTISGSPNGLVPDNEIIDEFEVHTTIKFYDDPYDGTDDLGTDSIHTDYKLASIDVSWLGRFADKKVSIFSKIIPNTEETDSGYGLLKLHIVDSGGSPVDGANIHIENASVSLNADYVSDSNGFYYLSLLPDFEGYEVTITKAGYSTEKTYTRDAINLNPTKPHISIFDGSKTEESFSIDNLALFTIRTVGNNLADNTVVNTELASSTDTLPKIALDSSDNIYYTWQSESSTSTKVKIQKFDSSLTKLWAADKTISNTRNQLNPDLAVAPSGDTYIVWQDNSSSLKLTAKADLGTKLASSENIYLDLEHYSKIPKHYSLASDHSLLSGLAPYENRLKKIYIDIKDSFSRNSANAQETANIVQSVVGNSSYWSSTLSATLPTPPTAGNMLVAIAVTRSGVTFSNPSNTNGSFTQAVFSDSGWTQDIGIWYKEVEASEPSQSIITASGRVRGGVLMLMEVSGIDASDPLDVVTSNDQNSSNSTTAFSGSTAVSETNAFAVAAIAFADDNFSTPNSSNWSSGSSNNWTHRLWDEWPTRDASVAVASLNIDNADNQSATLSLSGGGGEQRNSVLAVFNLNSVELAIVDTIGAQTTNAMIPSDDFYLGGAFTISENTSSRNITDISIAENGTVDAQTDLSDIKLFYDLDTSAPYDCASESYDPSDLQFGVSTNFDSSNGTASFSEATGVTVNLTQSLCLYPVVDILDTAAKDASINLYINNPSTDVIADSGVIVPASSIDISAETILQKPTELNISVYRFRNDDGDEINASWAMPENSTINMSVSDSTRLRFSVNNSGSVSSTLVEYQIEYAEKTNDCSLLSSWTALPNDTSQHWQIIPSAFITDGEVSSNVSPGLTDTDSNFVSGVVKDSSNISSGINLDEGDFSEIEYSIKPTVNALDSDYCFRLTNNGTTTSFYYNTYPEASIIGDDNIYIIGLDSDGNERWPVSKVNTDMAAVEQSLPRIALSQNDSSATSCIVWQDERNGNIDIYAQTYDSAGNKLWGSDLQITASTSDEMQAVVAFNSSDEIYIAWTNQESDLELYLNKYNLSGTALWSDPKKIYASSSDDYSPQIKTASDDSLVLTWTSANSGTKNVNLGLFNATTTSFDWIELANAEYPSDDQYSSNISINASYIFSSWTDLREGNEDVYVQRFDYSGNNAWAEDLKINVNTGSSDQSNSAMVINSSGATFAVWQDDKNINTDIYTSEFSAPGATLGQANVPIIVSGTKLVGDNPEIIKYTKHFITDSDGYVFINAEWDVPGYSVDLNPASTSLSVIMRDPIQPMEFLAGEPKSMIIYVD